ncbi:MAG: ATP-binding protein [Verrucomicrobia bacterium]|nr:ATP-binding protein [Verrucomicrobiota bacterium]
MKITRTSLHDSLERFVVAGHGVLIGNPGVGKTHSLKELATRAKKTGGASLRILFDQMGIDTAGDIERALGIDGDLVALLESDSDATPERPGYLILDAFDAARSDTGRRQLVHLIRRIIHDIGDKWHVIVSVRTYDAQRSTELLDLFPGGDFEPDFCSSNIKCRHFWIPSLRDEERMEAVASIKGLDSIFDGASQSLKELLRIPFNLWLMEKILTTEEPGRQLGQITSEVGLLEEFWKARVERGVKADARNMVARIVARAMVAQSSLSVQLEQVYDLKADETWQELLSVEVLEKVGRKNQDRVAFRHNMLFDYAVSRLLIDDSPEALAAFLKEDKARALFLRPSLYYHFASLWQSDLPTFWETYWRMLFDDSMQVRLFATLLPPLVAARELRNSEQLLPIMGRRTKEKAETDKALRRVLQALRVVEAETPPRDTAIDEGWVQTVRVLAADCSDDLSYELGTWTERALRRVKQEPKESLRRDYGQIARDLFRWIWERRKASDGARFDGQGSRLMLPLVTETFGTDPVVSRAILEPVLELLRVDGFPIDFVYRLADEVPNIWPHDPEFASLIYSAVFSRTESSEEKTNMGPPVLPMISTRRQDYRMCFYVLKQHFPAFIKACPIVAAHTALQVIEAYVQTEHIDLKENIPVAEDFLFRGGTARFVQDLSWIWNQGLSRRKDEIEIAGTLFTYIRDLAEKDDTKQLDEFLDIFRDDARAGFAWGQLLLAGAEKPSTLGIRLFDLFVAKPIRTHSETCYQLGECLKTTYPHLSVAQRTAIEKALLEVPAGEDPEDAEYRARDRDKILGCIPEALIATSEAIMLIRALKETDKLPANEPSEQFTSEWRNYSTDDFLKEKGADITKPANIQLRNFEEKLKAFVSDHRNKKPTPADVSAFLPQLQEVWKLLSNPGDAETPVIEYLWNCVSEATATAARGCERPDSDEYRLCREILIRSAHHEKPTPDPKCDEKYTFPHWSPAPRNEAAQGLPWLAVWNKNDLDVVKTLRRLANDPVPSVRFLAITETWRLNGNYEKECFEILNDVASREQNLVVLSGLSDSIGHLVGKHEHECVVILKRIYDNIRSEKSDTLLQQLVDIVVWLALSQANTWAREIMESFLADPVSHPRELQRATLEVLELLTPQWTSRDDCRPQTERSKAWLIRAIHAAADGLRNFCESKTDPNSEEAQKIAHGLYGVIDEVVTRTYFAAGLFKESKNNPPVSFEELHRYFTEMRPVLEEVLNVSNVARGGMLAAPTAHHFMQLLNGVLACDPKVVLGMATRVVKASLSGSFQFDSMAVREVVSLVESILSDHRVDARDQESLQYLLDLLDIFVDAGWPEALNLAWRLDEVFR